ncbi:hypothetical protein PG984_012242 [Apiospora sp. TS-2023a]
MASTLAQQAEEVRQRGNALYKKGKLTDAIKAYTEAWELHKSNYLPLSNLSAAYFETGQYRESVEFANNALQILAETPDSEPPKQKLLVRMTKSLLYLRDLETVKPIMERIEGKDERASLWLSFQRMHAIREPDHASVQEWRLIFRKLPKYKPQMIDEPDYFCVGHDTPESQLPGDLIRRLKPDEPASVLFCGIGDARNMFQTILEFPVDQSRKLHFMCLDHKPAVVARNVIFFHLFNEAAIEKDEEKSHIIYCTLAFLFTVSILPPFVWEKMQTTIRELLKVLEDDKQPIPWAHIAKEDIQPLCRVLRQWQPAPKGHHATKNARAWVAQGQLVDDDMWEAEDKLDHQFFEDFGTVTLPLPDAERIEPSLAEPLSAYWNKTPGSKSQLSAYINKTWKTNMTMIDMDWESKKQGIDDPDMSMNPLMTAGMLTSAIDDNLKQTFYKKGSVVEAIASDYTGGPLTSFLYGVPVLEMGYGTGLTASVLKNPPRWDSINQYLAEYLLMYDRKLIESHFHVRLSSTTPEGYEDAMWPMMPYYKWERVTPPLKNMSFDELMPQASLTKWLCSHFLKICLPYKRGPAFDLVSAPLNLTTFVRLLVHVSEIGYPAHWLSALVNNLLSGQVTTTARAPRRYVLRTRDVDKVYPAQKVSVEPWKMELAALISLWQPLLPFNLVTSSDMLAPAHEIHEYTVQFPDFFHRESPYVPHFMLVFWNQHKLEQPPANIRSLLLEDEDGDTTTSARFVRREVVRVVTTFNWSTDHRAATFWLRRGDMEEMVRDDWLLYVWRTDFWDKQSSGLSLISAEVTSRPFRGAE